MLPPPVSTPAEAMARRALRRHAGYRSTHAAAALSSIPSWLAERNSVREAPYPRAPPIGPRLQGLTRTEVALPDSAWRQALRVAGC